MPVVISYCHACCYILLWMLDRMWYAFCLALNLWPTIAVVADLVLLRPPIQVHLWPTRRLWHFGRTTGPVPIQVSMGRFNVGLAH